MRAVVFDEHGGTEVLHPAEIPDPRPRAGEVLVRVAACALNRLDLWVREPSPAKRAIPMPHIGGCDVAGVVEEFGPGTEIPGLKPGDPVLAAPGISCGECVFCLRNQESLCGTFNILGYQSQGGLAEKVVVPARNLLPLSPSSRYSLAEWAAFPLVFTTAWSMLLDKARLEPGETVLVQAAGSGVGSAAIQIAKAVGAKVITTVGQDWKIAEAQKWGADEAVNYRKEAFEKKVRDWTGGKGVNVVFDHIGPDVFEPSMRCLARGGRFVTCGSTSGAEVKLNLLAVFSKNISIHGNYMGSLLGLKKAVQWAEEGRLKPVVGKVFPLEKTREAQECLKNRDFFGKIVVSLR
jgi:NADPH:quinone reductase-like Zn-dependent oxidoreductase